MERKQSTDVDIIDIADSNVDDANSEGPANLTFNLRKLTTWKKCYLNTERANAPTNRSLPYDIESVYSKKSHLELRRKPRLFCSCRLILSVVSCLGFVNLYILRFNLNVAMPWMINRKAVNELQGPKNGILPNATDINHRAICAPSVPAVNPISGKIRNSKILASMNTNLKDGEFIWSEYMQTILLNSFFLGDLLTQILGGWLAERFGGKWFFGFAVLASALLNLLIPVAARTDYSMVVVIRVCLGIAQGVAWPAMFVIWSRWAPPSDKQKLTSLTYAGSLFGLVITFPGVNILCNDNEGGLGWPYVFYISGILGIVWTFAWFYLVFDSPVNHPRISRAEKTYICNGLRRTMPMSLKYHPPTPWKHILTCVPFWALIVCIVSDDFTTYVLIDSLSTYMIDVYGINREENAWINAIPYVGMFIVAGLSGSLFDFVTIKHVCSQTVARKIGNTIGTLLPGILIFAVSFMECGNKTASLVLIILCISITGFQYGAGYLNNFTDLAPQHVGVVFGIANMMSTVFGSTTPYVMKLFSTKNQPISDWQSMFKMLASVFLLNTITYVIFGSAIIQKWAETPVDYYSDNISKISEPSRRL